MWLPKCQWSNPEIWINWVLINILRPKQDGRHFADNISNAFSSMKIAAFWFKFHWNMLARAQLTIIQHCFRQWLGTEHATSHYLNQCWPRLVPHICVSRAQGVNSLRPSDAYIYASVNQPSLVQTMACRLTGSKPLYETMLKYCYLES